MKRFIVILCFFVSGIYAQESTGIHVVGKGVIYAVPDRVHISVRVTHQGRDVREVKRKNDKSVAELYKYLKNSGLSSRDYQTTYVSLRKYSDMKKTSNTYYYEASQAISIELSDIKKYDELMMNLLNSEVNEIDEVSFDVSDREKYLSQARKKSMENARQKAEEYAQVIQQKVGKAVKIAEDFSFSPRVATYRKAMDISDFSPTLMEGVISIEASVSVSFELL